MDTLPVGVFNVIPGSNCRLLCGNQREHYIEHKRARQYASTMLEDQMETLMNILKKEFDLK